MKLAIVPEPDFLRATVTGEFALDRAQQEFVNILEALTHAKASRVLVDGREVTGNPNIIQRFLYGESAALAVRSYVVDNRIPRDTKFAYILTPPVFDIGRFGETVAVNRGMKVKTFEKIDEGVAWLLSGASPAL